MTYHLLFIKSLTVFRPGQVSTMTLMENYLYIGVTSGNLLVVDPPTLDPLITISCHEGPIKNLIAIGTDPYIPTMATIRGSSSDSVDQSESLINAQSSNVTLMTVGPGFNDLIGGYLNSPPRFKGYLGQRVWSMLLWNANEWEQAVAGVTSGVRQMGDEKDVDVGMTSEAEAVVGRQEEEEEQEEEEVEDVFEEESEDTTEADGDVTPQSFKSLSSSSTDL